MRVLSHLALALASATSPPEGHGFALTFDERGTAVASVFLPPAFFHGATGLSVSLWCRAFGISSSPFHSFLLTMNTASNANWFQPFNWYSSGNIFQPLLFETSPQLDDARLHLRNFTRWRHLALSWASDGGAFRLSVDGELLHNLTGVRAGYNLSAAAAEGVRLWLGVYATGAASHRPADSFRGSLHDVRLWTRATHDEPEAPPSLRYTFDEGEGDVAHNSGAASGLPLRLARSPDGDRFFFSSAGRVHEYTAPVWAPFDGDDGRADAPLVYTYAPSAGAELSLDAAAPLVRLASVPPHGELTWNGTLLAPHDLVPSGAPLRFAAPPGSPRVAFAFAPHPANASNTTVHLLPHAPPRVAFDPPACEWPRGALSCTPPSLLATTLEDTPLTLFLYGADALGAARTRAVLSRRPSHGSVHQLTECCEPSARGAALSDGDAVADGSGGVVYVPPADWHGEANLSFYVTDARGAASAEATMIVSVAPVEDAPVLARVPRLFTAPLTPVYVPLAYSDAEGDAVAVTLRRAPARGHVRLHSAGGGGGFDAAAASVEEFNAYVEPSTIVRQFASALVGASSWWPSGTRWHPLQALGARDVESYGDSVYAWSPLIRDGDSLGAYVEGGGVLVAANNASTSMSFRHNPSLTYARHGYTEFLELQFASAVYANGVRVGENRGMCAVVRILARRSTGAGEYVTLWESAETAAERGECWSNFQRLQRYRVFAPTICRTTIQVDVLRIELDTRSVDDWNEIDFVELIGVTTLPEGVLPANASGVWYVPDAGFTGDDSFELAAYDCAFNEARVGQSLVVDVRVEGSFPPPSPPPRVLVPEVRIGVLLPMFGAEETGYAQSNWWPRSGAYQALREINNRSDGVADELLPNTALRFAFRDSKCDSTLTLQAAIELTRDAFDGAGVSAIVGAACSGSSVTAAQLLENQRIPLVSPSSTSPLLSDGLTYPYFLRTVPSDAFGAVAAVDVLRTLFNYTSVALVHSSDAYGAGGAGAFSSLAAGKGLTISLLESFPKDSTDFAVQHAALRRSAARVIVLYAQTSDGSRFIRSALDVGIGGAGYLWLAGDTLADEGLWESDAQLLADLALRERALKGFFALVPNGQRDDSTLYQQYAARRARLPPTDGDGAGGCNLETDDDGHYLWAQDHDDDPSTPLACAPYDLSSEGAYESFAYDAVFAVAHALHRLIEVHNRSSIVAEEVFSTLLREVRFDGVTGEIDFFDASADTQRLYHGDRRSGLTYTIVNYVSAAAGLLPAGSWQPCPSDEPSCSWAYRWSPTSGFTLTFSTPDNSRPPQTPPPRIETLNLGVLLPILRAGGEPDALVPWSPLIGVYQAVRELNNKSDGVADDLLPATTVRISFRDSQCDASAALQAAILLVQDDFDGEGADAIIGAGCSVASATAAQVCASRHIPIISPTSTSPHLSDGELYPFFLRTCPSDSFGAVAIVDILRNLFNYDSVALVHSTDDYGSGAAVVMADVADEQGLLLLVTVSFASGSTDFSRQHRQLRQSGSRVVVIFCNPTDGGLFMRTAYEERVAGAGFLWIGGDFLSDESVWQLDAPLAANTTLRELVLKGYFCSVPNGQPEASPLYQSYAARRAALPPTIGADGSCNLERGYSGSYLWAATTEDGTLICAPHDSSADGLFDGFAYDAVFAVASALHHLIETENRTAILQDDLLHALLHDVSFDGVTGAIAFHDASGVAGRPYHGDRRVGLSYRLLNFVDASEQLVELGRWRPCPRKQSCDWASRWTAEAGRAPTFSTETNTRPPQTAAVSCPYGEVLNDERECVCQDGFELDPSGRCRRCNVGQDSRRATSNSSGSDGCSLCAEGYYRRNPWLPAAECQTCEALEHADCPLNATIDVLVVHEGFWRLSGASLEVQACPLSEQGRRSPCRGGSEAGALGEGYCRAGFRGPRCQLCANTTQYFSEGECLDCPSVQPRIALFSVLLLLFLGLLFGVPLLTIRLVPGAHAYAVRSWSRGMAALTSLALIPKLKLVIAFFQIVSLLPAVYGLKLPSYYYDWVDFIKIFEFDWSSAIIPASCLSGGFEGLLLLRALGPIALVATVVAGSCVFSLIPFKNKQPQTKRPRRAKFLSSLPIVLLIAFFMTPSTSFSIFAAWTCESFHLDSTATPPKVMRYLRGELSLECNTSVFEYRRLLTLAYILVAIWPVGVPLFFIGVLHSGRWAILHGQSTRIVRATAFLHREYEQAYYWWEVVFLLQRLLVVGFAQWVTHPSHRLLFAMIIALVYLVAVLAVKPYKRNDVGFMAYSSQFASVLIFFMSTYIHLFGTLDEVDDTDTQDLSARVLAFESLDSLVASSIAIVFLFVGVFLALTLYQMAHSSNVQQLRLVSSSQSPELSLDTGKLFHLFLSHIWSSGQDQVANIKRKLQLMLPGCKIFLDVDDLDDISNLERHVEASQCVLIFLSKGYFASVNCVREFESALCAMIPLVLVHERDVSKGGVPLETLCLECTHPLFDGDHEIIEWQRAGDFQLLALKRIAQSMLYATPLYRKAEEPPTLYLPGELTSQVLVFRDAVSVYASDSNPGAIELMKDLQSRFKDRHLTVSSIRPVQLQPKGESRRGSSLLAGARRASSTFAMRSTSLVGKRVLMKQFSNSTGVLRSNSSLQMILYLNHRTFIGPAGHVLADEVREARRSNVEIVLAHENDEGRLGCPFAKLFETTPDDLVQDGLYRKLAVSMHCEPYRAISFGLLAKAFGAAAQRSKAYEVFRSSVIKRKLSKTPTSRISFYPSRTSRASSTGANMEARASSPSAPSYRISTAFRSSTASPKSAKKKLGTHKVLSRLDSAT